MKRRKSFGVKLCGWFILFAAAIFAVLWLLQTVFLQNFYNDMAIRGVDRAAEEMAEHAGDTDFHDFIDETAVSRSLLVFVTDSSGQVLYSADEYRRLYGEREQGDRGSENPWISSGEVMNWEKGALRNLPYSYDTLLDKMKSSGSDRAGFVTEDGAAYVTGIRLENGDILSVSMPLGTVGGTVQILRVQLIWVSILSLILSFCLAWVISRRFGSPVAQIVNSAKEISEGNYHAPDLPRGFCTELDELSDTLEETARRLERAKNAQRDLLANVSHDLRTPLTMIKGYAEMVKEISWEDPEKRNQDLDIIMRESDRLTALVNEILEFSAMQSAAPGERQGTPVDMSRVTREVVEQFAPFCARNGFTVETDIADNLEAAADEGQIRRVIYNFIDNAVNHTDESRRVHVALKRSGARVRFEVTDFGKGVPPEDIPYIWDRYYTARNRKNKAAVSGLGLSIAKEILTRHHAQYGVYGQDNCTFWFEL